MGRARVEPAMGSRLGAKRSDTCRYHEHLQRRLHPIAGSTRRAGAIFGARRRCQLVVWLGHTPRRRLAWHRNSPRRGPDPKPDSLLGGALQAAPGQRPGPSPGTSRPQGALCPGSAPRRKYVLRYPTLAYQHEHAVANPSRVATKCSVAFPIRQRLSITTAVAEKFVRPLDIEKPNQRSS